MHLLGQNSALKNAGRDLEIAAAALPFRGTASGQVPGLPLGEKEEGFIEGYIIATSPGV